MSSTERSRAKSLTIALAVFGMGCAVAFLIGLAVEAPYLRIVVKPIPVLCLTVWLALAVRARDYALVSVGLVCSAVGDILLAAIDLGADPKLFFGLGLSAFLIAHLWYIAAFVRRDRRLHLPFLAPFIVWGVVVYFLIRPNLGHLTIPVLIYIAVICTMLWRATCLMDAAGRRISLVQTAGWGALFFGLSDSLIAIDKFYESFDAAHYAIIVTYWIGQTGIALSVPLGNENRAA